MHQNKGLEWGLNYHFTKIPGCSGPSSIGVHGEGMQQMEFKTEQCVALHRNAIMGKMPSLFYISISIHYFSAGLLWHFRPGCLVSSATPCFFLIIEILHSCLVKCQIQTQVSSLCPRLALWWLLTYPRVNFQTKSTKALNFWEKMSLILELCS